MRGLRIRPPERHTASQAVWLRRGLMLSGMVVLLLVVATNRVAGQEGDLQAQSAATYTFGQNMQFSLRAKSADEINGATLFFNTPEMTNTYAVELELEPAREIALEHELPLTQVQLAPFTTVHYWWRLTTESGTLMVDEKTLAYVDDRFMWQELAREGVDVHWTGQESTLGQVALDVIDGVRPQLQAVFPGEIEPLDVYIYPSMADLRSALRLTGRDWLGGEAMPELGVLLVTSVNPRTAAFDLGQSIPHELSHLLIYRRLGAQYGNVPRWFDEGLATSLEMAQDVSYEALLTEAVAQEATIPLEQLCAAFPEGDAEVRLAYAQSASVVKFIRQSYGMRALRDLVDAYADGAACGSGVQRVLGETIDELEYSWLAGEKPVSPFVRFLRLNGLWVTLAGAGFLIMGLLLIPMRKQR